MTAVAQIITDAYQYNNLVAINAIPTADEQAKGLRYLNRIFRNIFGAELGEGLQTFTLGTGPLYPNETYSIRPSDITLVSPYVLVSNSRLVVNATMPLTIYFPANPQDGARISIQDAAGVFNTYPLTVQGNGRKIGTVSSAVLNTAGTNLEWFYRADIVSWVLISDLLLTDLFPFPQEFEEYFIAMLSMRLGSSEDVDLSPSLQYLLKDGAKKLRLRYRQRTEVRSELGLIVLTNTLSTTSFTG